MKAVRHLVLVAFAATCAAACSTTPATTPTSTVTSTSTAASTAARVPRYDHIVILVMENKSSGDVLDPKAAPNIHKLVLSGALATDYHAVTHPSLPNYLALTGGDTFGIHSDCDDCFVNAPDIAGRVAASGRTWKAYMEGAPGTCPLGNHGRYAQKHDPFVYYNDIRTTPQCQKVVPFGQLAGDLRTAATTPAYVWISPDLCNDMHDCSVTLGDTWLGRHVPQILQSPAFTQQKSLMILTWDENDGGAGNQVPAIFVGSGVRPGTTDPARATHYSLLRTIEDSWGLQPLTANDAAARPMTGMF